MMAGKKGRTASNEKIWNFAVSDPTLHQDGFTIYKVTCKVFLLRSQESLTEIVVWKRYNDFKQLYKSMAGLHKALHRKEQFPAFAKPKLFGRFDESVIEERRMSALTLLEFVGAHSYLYKSKEFTAFLKTGKIRQGLSGEILKPSKLDMLQPSDIEASESQQNSEILQPTKHPPEADTQNAKEAVEELPENGDSQEDSLEGVWQYPQVPDNISLNSYDDTDTSEVDSALGTPLPESDISFFDPISADNSLDVPPGAELRHSSSWLFAAMNTCAEMEQESESEARSELTDSQNGIQISFETDGDNKQELESSVSSSRKDSLETPSLRSSSTDLSEFDPLKSKSRSGSKVEIGKGDLDLSGAFGDKSSAIQNTEPKVTSSLVTKISRSPFRRKPRSTTNESVSTMDLGGKEDYIYLAANQICLAQDCEASSKFDMAFGHYKSGVGILLQGVQSDKNKARRDAVRRKTAQYLLKAEDLYNRHLSKEILDDKRWAEDSKLSPTCEMDPSVAMLKGSTAELKNFKVLGTIDKVLLVMDKTTDETYVMKTIHKSSNLCRKTKTILPTNCPYMVSLYKFYETESAIHLLLQHATGGKLWNYIGAYLQGRSGGREAPDSEASHFGNVYAGTKLHEHDNSSQGYLHGNTDVGAGRVGDVVTSSSEMLIRFSQKNGEGEIKIGADRSENERTNSLEDEEVPRDYDRMESFSSAEDGAENSDMKPASFDQKDFVFQEILQDSKSNLEQFSIISTESTSSECRARVDSFVFDKSDIIHEENEVSHFDSGLMDDQDTVFSDERERKSSQRNKEDSEIIVQSARELLRSVDRTLSQTDAEVKEMLSPEERKAFINTVEPHLCKDRAVNNLVSETVMSGHSSATVIDDSDSNEVSIYDVHRSSSSTDSSDVEKCHKSDSTDSQSKGTNQSDPSVDACDSRLSNTSSKTERTDTLTGTDTNVCSDSQNSPLGSKKTSRSSTLVESSSSRNIPPAKLSLTRMNSKELSRSASMEHELTSPPRSRQRTVSDVFKEMDKACSTPDNVRLPESCIRQWIAEIVVALGRLHAEGIICRDLKPDNILLGDRGHVILTYFCQLNQVDQEIDYAAAEELFVAPEVKNVGGYTECCDWWSLGALMYELVLGRSLSSCHPGGITCHTQLYLPDHVSPEAHSLLKQLLCNSYRERVGCGMNGAEDIKAHPFFSGIDWNQLEN